MSRIAILQWLIDVGMRLLRGLGASAGAGRSLVSIVGESVRIQRWLRVAIFLSFRIDQGALDAPRQPRPARPRRAAGETMAQESAETCGEAAEACRPRVEYERLEWFLDQPFGESVARICRGLGLKPDWDAWAGEPWAEEEIRTRPPTSPYANYAAAPPGDAARAVERPPPTATLLGPGSAAERPGPGAPRAPSNAAQAPPTPPLLNRKSRRAQATAARRRSAPARAPRPRIAL